MKRSVKLRSDSARVVLEEILALDGETDELIYLVGGAVRDLLLKGEVEDVDSVVEGSVERVARKLAQRRGGTAFEMHPDPLTYRVVSADGALPHVDLVQLKGELEEDLWRRDFTINAMAAKLLSVSEGQAELELLDPCGGEEDLSTRCIRPVSASALAEDPVRLLRCFRLACSLGFKVSDEALAAVEKHREKLKTVAAERVRDELLMLLDITPCYSYLRDCAEVKLLEEVLPELEELRGVMQKGPYCFDIYEHTMSTVQELERLLLEEGQLVEGDWGCQVRAHLQQPFTAISSRVALVKLAALLHDIAKPATRSIEEDGRTRFLGHNKVGAEMAGEIGRRLRLGKGPVRLLSKLVREHLRPAFLARESPPTTRAVNRFFYHLGDLVVEVLLLGLADCLATVGGEESEPLFQRQISLTNQILTEYWQAGREEEEVRLVNGYEVMERYCLAEGPMVGRLLKLVEEARLDGKLRTKQDVWEYLDSVADALLEGEGGG